MCNIEIKPCPGREAITGKKVALAAAEYFKDAPIAPLISSFYPDALAAAYKAAPQLPRAFLCETYNPAVKKLLKKLECVAVNPSESTLDKKTIDAIHKAGYRICAWTVNDYRRAKTLLEWGCDAIFTDELDRIPPSMA